MEGKIFSHTLNKHGARKKTCILQLRFQSFAAIKQALQPFKSPGFHTERELKMETYIQVAFFI